ncbi:MAG TPA: EndoU domain-containing protein [Candidatus Dependentiae bacterium]|nr:EndoU domain-containing protein [Candidatus Dependentiae bacterium]HRQ62542.1 EndoU domain-containing protein [Candidatus Dependentiae bacterium]
MLVPIYKKITLLWLVLMNPGMSVPPMRYTVLYDQSHITFTNAQETLTFSGEQIDAIVSSMPSDIQVNFVNGRWDWNRLADYVQDNNITPASIVPDQIQSNHQPRAPINRATLYHNNANKEHYMVTVAHVSESKLHKLYNHRDIQALQKIRDELQSEIRWSYVTALFWPSVRKPMRELLAQAESYIQDIQDAMANNVNHITRHVSDQNSPRLRMILSTGSNHALQQKKNILLQESRTTWHAIKQDYAYNQAMHADTMLKEPITEILFTIMTADLARAQAEFNALEDSWPWYGGELCVSKQQAHEILQYIKRVGFNELQVAREIMQVRLSQEGPVKRKSAEQKPAIAMDHNQIQFDDSIELVSTPAYNYSYNISPEKDTYLNNLLDKIKSDSSDFDQYLEWSALALEANSKSGMLKAEQPVSLIDHAAYATHLIKIASAECLSRFDPTLQITDYVVLIKELGLLTIDMGLGAAHVLQFGDLANKDIQTEQHGIVNTRELMPQRLRNRIEMFETLWHTMPDIMNQLAQMPAEDQARIIGRIIGDIAFAKGIAKTISLIRSGEIVTLLQEGGELAANFKNTIKNGIKNISNKPTVVTPEGLTVKVGQEAGETSSWFQNTTDKVVGGAQKALSAEQTLLEAFAENILGRLEKEIECLRNMFDFKRKGFGKAANKFLKFNYKHILGFDLHFNKKGVMRFGGLHHDFRNIIEQSQSFKFINKITHESGFYKADILVNGKLLKDKTFFPSHWTREQVLDAICQVYDSFVKNIPKEIMEKGGKYVIEASFTDGVKIRMFMTENGLITSAYPILK